MERVKVTVVCDRCEQDTDLNPGSGIEIAFGPQKSEVDLCDDCRGFLIMTLEPVLTNGRALTPAPKTRKERARIVCPDCQKDFLAGAGYTLHRMKKHPEEEDQHGYTAAAS